MCPRETGYYYRTLFDTNTSILRNFNLAQLLFRSTNSFYFFTRCSYRKYETLLKFSCILTVIKVLELCHENRDFWLNREKHIVALASAETKTELCSNSGPSGSRTRVFRPLSGPSGNTAAGACQRPDVKLTCKTCVVPEVGVDCLVCGF